MNADFPVALRGYDRLAVDAYVQRTSQLVAELQATRSPEAAVRRALERVGEQISGILQRAHETAEQITAQSRREAEDRLEQARVEAAEIAAAADQRVRDLDADTDRIWIERHRIVDDARDLASQLLALAEAAAERFPRGRGARSGRAVRRRDRPPEATSSPSEADYEPADFDAGPEARGDRARGGRTRRRTTSSTDEAARPRTSARPAPSRRPTSSPMRTSRRPGPSPRPTSSPTRRHAVSGSAPARARAR